MSETNTVDQNEAKRNALYVAAIKEGIAIAHDGDGNFYAHQGPCEYVPQARIEWYNSELGKFNHPQGNTGRRLDAIEEKLNRLKYNDINEIKGIIHGSWTGEKGILDRLDAIEGR